MAKTGEIYDLEALRPADEEAADGALYVITGVKGSRKSIGDFVHVSCKPYNDIARMLGSQTFRFPGTLTRDSALGRFAVMMGDDPTKTVDPRAWEGRVLSLQWSLTDTVVELDTDDGDGSEE